MMYDDLPHAVQFQ